MNYLGPSGKQGGWFPNAPVKGQPTGIGTDYPYGPMTLNDASSLFWKVQDWQVVAQLVITGNAATTTTATNIFKRGWGEDAYHNGIIPGTNTPYWKELDVSWPLVTPSLPDVLANFEYLVPGTNTAIFDNSRNWEWLVNGVAPRGPYSFTGLFLDGSPFNVDWNLVSFGIPIVSGYQFNIDASGLFWLHKSNALFDAVNLWTSASVRDGSVSPAQSSRIGYDMGGSGGSYYQNYFPCITLTLPSGAVISELPYFANPAYGGGTDPAYTGSITPSIAIRPNSYFAL